MLEHACLSLLANKSTARGPGYDTTAAPRIGVVEAVVTVKILVTIPRGFR